MNEHDEKSERPEENTTSDRREFLTAVTAAVAAGTVGGLATGAQAQGTFQATPMNAMRAQGNIALTEVGVTEMPVRGTVKVSPATAALLKNLSSAISQTIRNNPGASSEYVQYGYGSSIAGASRQELVVR